MRHFNRQPVAYLIAFALGCLSASALASKHSDDIVVMPAVNNSEPAEDDSEPEQDAIVDITMITGGVEHTYSAASAPASSDSSHTVPHAHDNDASDTATVGFYGELIILGKATGAGLPGGYGYSKVIGGGHVQEAEAVRPVSVFSSDR